mgnify:CR=1 FL=1
MIKVTISDAHRAMDAGEWCNEQFGDYWKLNGQNLFTGPASYDFWFYKEQDAVLFALKWL